MLLASMRVHGTLLASMVGRLAWLVLALAAPMKAAEPGPGHIVFHRERPSFRAGDVVKVRWTPLPPEAEEFELLLSIDGGHHFIRLTEMQDPRLESLEWRVPNLPSRDARLRLRIGLNGEEVELELSAPLTILRDDDVPLAGVTFRGGEWWTSQTVSVALPDLRALHQHAESPSSPEWGAHLAPSLARDHVAAELLTAVSTVPISYTDPNPIENPLPLGRSPRVTPRRE